MPVDSRPHMLMGSGYWECLMVGKNNVTVSTVRRGFLACGHCLTFITDAEGNRVPWTLTDQLRKRGWINGD